MEEEVTIYTTQVLEYNLVDKRRSRWGSSIGTIGGVARQLGIKMSKNGEYYAFTAPAKRLQVFAEKLHFAGVKFSEEI